MISSDPILPLDSNTLMLISQVLDKDLDYLSKNSSRFKFSNNQSKLSILKNVKENISYLETGIQDLQILIKMLVEHEKESSEITKQESESLFEHSIICDLDGRILSMNSLAKIFFYGNENANICTNILDLNDKFLLDIKMNIHSELGSDVVNDVSEIKDFNDQYLKIKSKWILYRDKKKLHSFYKFVFIILSNESDNCMNSKKQTNDLHVLYRSALHDFRTILTQVSSGLDIMANVVVNNEFDNLLDLLKKGLKRGDNIIDFIQEKNFKRLNLESVYLDSLIIEAQNSFKNDAKNIKFDYIKNNDILKIKVDENQIFLVICNIYKNAIQAMNKGGTITTMINIINKVENEKVKNYLVLSIKDEGHGIPNSDIDHIFDSDYSTKSNSHAQGIGLANAQFVLIKHGGFIQVESKCGLGTTFKLNFPI